jgi:hypothetical protein
MFRSRVEQEPIAARGRRFAREHGELGMPDGATLRRSLVRQG